MNKNRIIRIVLPLLFIAVGAAFLFLYPNTATSGTKCEEQQYYINQGHIFGTYYNIRYEATHDLHNEILAELKRFDNSLSTFNPNSTLSKINSNQSDTTDLLFENMFLTAERISRLSDGAFDITVAPLVNAWGFGFKNKEQVTPYLIDSLLQLVGYEKIRLEDHHLLKSDSRIMLDASAIAKGYGCDVIAELLKKNNSHNYLVDIGGEVSCKGVSSEGSFWRIGIDKPNDDPTGTNHELTAVVSAAKVNIATSGNYRQFYYENGIRRSHTINPHTGYPVEHQLLSATVVAPSCMEADALATACMVLGKDRALEMIEQTVATECMLIYADESGNNQVVTSNGMSKYIVNK